MSVKEIVCITCPRGCTMQVTVPDDNAVQDETIEVKGNFCKRGADFARDELVNPMRTICSTVSTIFPQAPVLPCRVSADIPKSEIWNVMAEINKVVVSKPIHRGDVIISDVLGLGVDVISTSDLLFDID